MKKQDTDDEDANAYTSGGFETWDDEPKFPTKGFLISIVLAAAVVTLWLF